MKEQPISIQCQSALAVLIYGYFKIYHRNRQGHICRLCCQKQVSQAGIGNYIPQFTVGCNYVSLPEIPVSGNKVHICYHSLWSHKQSSIQLMYFLFVLYQSDQPFLLWPKKRDHEIRIWNLEIKNAKKQLQNNSSKLFREETWQGVLDT